MNLVLSSDTENFVFMYILMIDKSDDGPGPRDACVCDYLVLVSLYQKTGLWNWFMKSSMCCNFLDKSDPQGIFDLCVHHHQKGEN